MSKVSVLHHRTQTPNSQTIAYFYKYAKNKVLKCTKKDLKKIIRCQYGNQALETPQILNCSEVIKYYSYTRNI